MARLFITPREMNFINDIAKEVIKDVVGQKIYLFQISEIKSKVHDIYEESPDKVFETPIELDCLADNLMQHRGKVNAHRLHCQDIHPHLHLPIGRNL